MKLIVSFFVVLKDALGYFILLVMTFLCTHQIDMMSKISCSLCPLLVKRLKKLVGASNFADIPSSSCRCGSDDISPQNKKILNRPSAGIRS